MARPCRFALYLDTSALLKFWVLVAGSEQVRAAEAVGFTIPAAGTAPADKR